LGGIRVLDLSRLLPGPFCSMVPADLGADVIKVEDPKLGDYIRWRPPLIGRNSAFHVVLNRKKRSLTLKSPEGKELFRRQEMKADVLLKGFRPGGMRRLGLGYESLKTLNPLPVYCAITGYGSDGPLASRIRHDINHLARSGVFSYSGRDGIPTLSGVQIADLGGAGLPAAFSIPAAMLARLKVGEGQLVDISRTDGALAWNCLRWGKTLADGVVPCPGDDFLNHGFACYNLYRTPDDRTMALGALEPQFWEAFCSTVDRPEWKRPDDTEPGPHQAVLIMEISAMFARKSSREWVEIFSKADCCCELVLNLREVMDDPQVRARRMVVEVVHQSWRAYRQRGIAPKFSATPGSIRTCSPERGEHTDSILAEMGLETHEIGALRSGGVV